MAEDLVKQSINFLEYPLWFQDERQAEIKRGQTWSDRDGYLYRAGYKMPVKTDGIFLLYLLLQSQRNNYAPDLMITRYQVLKNCGLALSQVWYDRLEDSLERWKMVGISFEGTFYDGNTYSAMNFGIIDSWKIDEKTKNLKIRFSQEFLTMMLGKGFFKYINFSEFKKLHSPLATRLYEILCKSFHSRDHWEIDAGKMAEKIPMKERFPAHIIPKIQTAVSRINKSTSSKFEFSTRQSETESRKVILCFRKLPEVVSVQPPNRETKPETKVPQTGEVKALIALLPAERQNQRSVLEIVIAFYDKNGSDYVARNIRYTNIHAKKNFRPYLLKALRADYGMALQEDEEAQKQVEIQASRKIDEIARKQVEERRRRKLEQEAQARAHDYIAALTPDAREALEQEAIAGMDEKIRDSVIKNGMGSKILLKLAMEQIVTARLAAAKTQEQKGFLSGEFVE